MSTTLTPSSNGDPPGHGRWRVALLGPPGPRRQAVKRLLWLVPSYSFAGLMLALGVHMQRIPPASLWLMTAYCTVGLLIFYGLLRSGWAARRAEPTLAFPQVMFGIGSVLLTYMTIELTRALALQWLCLTLVFDMHRLSRRQVLIATLTAMVGLTAIVGQQLLMHPGRYNIVGELINIVMASLSMPILVLVSGIARQMRKQSEQQKIELAETLAQMQALAIRDGLTRAFTRGHLQQLLDEEVARQRRSRRVFCVAMLDIDYFKKINDKHGHAIGDAVLIDFARVAQATIDKSHMLARWGGEEFLVLMPETSLPHAVEALARLREAIHQHDWHRLAPDLKVTFSGGVCQHLRNDKTAQVIEQADEALYTAKAQGRDRVVAASSPNLLTERAHP